MKNFGTACLVFFALFYGLVGVSVYGQAHDDLVLEADSKRLGDARRFSVNCDRGATLTWALQRAKLFPRAEIFFRGTCEELLLIDRDHLTLRGSTPTATLLGRVDIAGASNVVVKDFQILPGTDQPTGNTIGAVNILSGSEVVVENMRIEDVDMRGVRAIASSVTLRDLTILRTGFGGIVTRGSNLLLDGTIVSRDSGFGLSLVYSNAFARNAFLEFSGGVFGMIVQLSSGLEHVEGGVKATGNRIGILLAGQGVYAFGGRIELNDNSLFGALVDEVSSLTPLIGAPGGGPKMFLENNPRVGILASRYSTVELPAPTLISGAATGMVVENSAATITGSTFDQNSETDLTLSFGASATINGEDNVINKPIQCDASVLIRGNGSCDTAVSAQRTPLTEGMSLQEIRRLASSL